MASTPIKPVPPKPGDRPTDPDPDRARSQLLTPAEAAEYLGVTERWVRRAVAERRLPHVRVGKLLRIAKADVSRYIADRRVEAE